MIGQWEARYRQTCSKVRLGIGPFPYIILTTSKLFHSKVKQALPQKHSLGNINLQQMLFLHELQKAKLAFNLVKNLLKTNKNISRSKLTSFLKSDSHFQWIFFSNVLQQIHKIFPNKSSNLKVMNSIVSLGLFPKFL